MNDDGDSRRRDWRELTLEQTLKCKPARWAVDSRCRLLIVPLCRGSSRFESLILSHHSRFTCECTKEEINDDDDDDDLPYGSQYFTDHVGFPRIS